MFDSELAILDYCWTDNNLFLDYSSTIFSYLLLLLTYSLN